MGKSWAKATLRECFSVQYKDQKIDIFLNEEMAKAELVCGMKK